LMTEKSSNNKFKNSKLQFKILQILRKFKLNWKPSWKNMLN
jgi:hypothetical protein